MPNQPHQRWRSSVAMQARARELRHEMTPAERKLWQRIRNGQLDGAHIRKQHADVSLRAFFAKQSPGTERGDCFVGNPRKTTGAGKRLLAMTG